MAANFQDCRRLVLIARKHVKDEAVLKAMLEEMRDAVADTANKSVRDTFERLVAERASTHVPSTPPQESKPTHYEWTMRPGDSATLHMPDGRMLNIELTDTLDVTDERGVLWAVSNTAQA